jgi:hypothetical protein
MVVLFWIPEQSKCKKDSYLHCRLADWKDNLDGLTSLLRVVRVGPGVKGGEVGVIIGLNV